MATVVAAAAGYASPCLGQEAPAQPGQVLSQIPQLPQGTTVKLMVTKEVNSRDVHPGDRFKLRVHEAVVLDGVTVIPVGTTAWGEVISAEGTGIAGGKGRLTAHLLYIELPTGRIPISGTQGREGKGNTAGVALSVLSFGLAGLLNKGGNAMLKAGDILTGYTELAAGPVPAPVLAPASKL